MLNKNKFDWVNQLGVEVKTLKQASKNLVKTDDYYVYIIWKMYGKLPIPFYVGKGHKQRLIKHEMESEADNNIYKTRIIKKHKKLGIPCGYTIFDFYEDEQAALDAEVELIELIGRYDLKKGPLANRTDGGDGTRGHLALKRGDSRSARPVIAEGIRYECLHDAADVLLVTSGAISGRIKSGWEGYYYEDVGQQKQTKKILGRYKKAAIVEGKEFESISDASRSLGFDIRMISKRIYYGWEGYYFKDIGQLPRKTIWGNRADKVPVIIKGKKYATVADAVRDTGESLAMVSKRCLSSNYPDYIRLDGKIEEKTTPPRTAEKIIIDDVIYDSIQSAADSFNLTSGGVIHRCKSGNYSNWSFHDETKQDNESFQPIFTSIAVGVNIEGTQYKSQSQAARSYKIDINTLKKRCRSMSFPLWHCAGVDKEAPKDGRPGMICINIDGIEYRSVSEASRKLGITRPTIKKRLQSSEWENYLSR